MDSYKLDFSEVPELSQINPVFHCTLLKPYQPNDRHQFPAREFEKPAPVVGDFWEVEKIMEFRQEPKTHKPRYKIRRKGYGPKDDSWTHPDDISKEILQEFWRSGNMAATYKKRPVGNFNKRRNTRQSTLSMIAQDRDKIMGLYDGKVIRGKAFRKGAM